MTSDYVTVKDVVTMLGISRDTVYNWERAGHIPAATRHPFNNFRIWKRDEIAEIADRLKEALHDTGTSKEGA